MLFAPILFIYVFSTWPPHEFHPPDESQLLISLRQRTQQVHFCTPEELEAFKEKRAGRLKHMRSKNTICGSLERVPMEVKVWVDGVDSVNKTLHPPGVYSNGVIYVFERFNLKYGVHDVRIAISELRTKGTETTLEFNEKIDFQPHQVVLITYEPEVGKLFIHD